MMPATPLKPAQRSRFPNEACDPSTYTGPSRSSSTSMVERLRSSRSSTTPSRHRRRRIPPSKTSSSVSATGSTRAKAIRSRRLPPVEIRTATSDARAVQRDDGEEVPSAGGSWTTPPWSPMAPPPQEVRESGCRLRSEIGRPATAGPGDRRIRLRITLVMPAEMRGQLLAWAATEMRSVSNSVGRVIVESLAKSAQ